MQDCEAPTWLSQIRPSSLRRYRVVTPRAQVLIRRYFRKRYRGYPPRCWHPRASWLSVATAHCKCTNGQGQSRLKIVRAFKEAIEK